ncbi:hypothetical protein ADL19_31550 [Streptomyces purpurogeneiscleroticus]|nr:hypothetical protein ADL19_31550 [Streptomyces purpurogeneiscleroticus]
MAAFDFRAWAAVRFSLYENEVAQIEYPRTSFDTTTYKYRAIRFSLHENACDKGGYMPTKR